MDGQFVEKNRAEVDRMRRQYSDDFVYAGVPLTKRAADPILEPGEFTDDWGCLFAAAPDGVGSHPTRPIVNDIDEWEAYIAEGMPEIDPGNAGQPVREAVAEHPERYVAAQVWRTFYERMFMLVGYGALMLEIATEGGLFRAMVEVLQDFTLRAIKVAADAGADAVFLADDWGTQHRTMISPDAWAKSFKPTYAAMIELAHSRGLDVWFHSCGNIAALLPHWIDIGLDVISPLQAAAMDLPAVAAAYRGQITFFGGIDVQHNLVHGTRTSIREEVRSLFRVFHAREGQYMASPCNTIMPETPVENAWILFEAIEEYGRFESE
jgi:uroporphyrinogen decarboxylase